MAMQFGVAPLISELLPPFSGVRFFSFVVNPLIYEGCEAQCNRIAEHSSSNLEQIEITEGITENSKQS